MKALFEMVELNVTDIVTASTGNDCELYSGGTGTQCQGDDDC